MSKLKGQLREARIAAKLSKIDMASRAGLSRMTVWNAEDEHGDPRLSTVEAMARELKMELLLVPAALRPALEDFIRSGGRFLGQPAGAGAPRSIVDALVEDVPKKKGKKANQ